METDRKVIPWHGPTRVDSGVLRKVPICLCLVCQGDPRARAAGRCLEGHVRVRRERGQRWLKVSARKRALGPQVDA